MRQHSGVAVQRMEIKFPLQKNAQRDIDRWVNFAIASKTKELSLDLSDPNIAFIFFVICGYTILTDHKVKSMVS
ncbi:hypothetical protein E2562_022339 [Oryza meyeriana var. granulata]|uniref:Uncharacterized protein n=1 Tax=Oryza meyeriana var. granulata TaxID=110450 RepID=A0A6G1D856_9ORYZ|nr:hypothetical protein E2562_022339 [Oryza meyeriana var. granulata]